ncbi:MAG: hypothetical protein LBL00_08775 [Endomicrobium sp.]|jgi:hypothetical protein|nr:hypothetical protein [Endomicrobium sp.]
MKKIFKRVQKIYPEAYDCSNADRIKIEVTNNMYIKEFPAGIYRLGTLDEEICRSTDISEIVGVVRAIKKCNIAG